MASLSDQIERHLKKLLDKYRGTIEIKRNKLADEFNCAPSQINYVLDTRFTSERGFVVESQRGGGGYIRIIKVKMNSENKALKKILSKLNGMVTQNEAEGIIQRLYENNLINEREKHIMEMVVHRRVIGVDLPHRDYIRGRILQSMLEVIMKYEKEEE
ncbi:MAG TPA: CtsR family transcriptional regulator [Halanaerobiales bacterium]|nr:CtsR family transcriptional regulator [Halanaerobiales bacterium]